MDEFWRNSLWQQYGAAIDTLADALKLCPESLWDTQLWDDEDDARYGQFWYIAYHTLFWTDLFLSAADTPYKQFTPPAPFVRGKLPDKPYEREDISQYLKQCRHKCKSIIEELTVEQAKQNCVFPWMQLSYLELQLYSLRHIQEHAAQLNMILGHRGIGGQDWVAQARGELT